MGGKAPTAWSHCQQLRLMEERSRMNSTQTKRRLLKLRRKVCKRRTAAVGLVPLKLRLAKIEVMLRKRRRNSRTNRCKGRLHRHQMSMKIKLKPLKCHR
jgi:hypothetical protein